VGLRDHVILTGRQTDVLAFYANADLFLHPALEEGFGISILEAMYHGIPVVSSDAGGIPEILDHGKYGAMFPAGDTERLHSILLDFLTGQPVDASLLKAARDRASDFAWLRQIVRYEEFYTECIRRDRTR
jgi:glycosyltransferase involved in cell wall biosynthesis